MHPLVFFAIDSQDRARRHGEDLLIWRNARANRVPPQAVERDSRWAAAVGRLAKRNRGEQRDCDGVVA